MSGLAAFVLISPAMFAQQASWSGTPADVFRTRIVNAGRAEAIPVSLQEVTLTNGSGGPGLKVTLDSSSTVKLDPGTKVSLADAVIRARIEPRTWEYKMLRLPGADDDAAARLLNAEGGQGWEMAGVVATTSSGSTVTLKRQK